MLSVGCDALEAAVDVVEAAEVAAGHLVPFLLFLPFLYLQNLPLHDAAPASPSCHVMPHGHLS